MLTQDTTLDSDLVNCPGHGVVIGASGITLDLAGHTIDGTYASGSRGVNNRGGHDGVTVKHGTIREFGVSVDLLNQRGGELGHLVADGLILVQESPDIRVERNVVGGGIQVIGDSDRVLITRNDVDRAFFVQGGLPPIGTLGPPFFPVFPDDVIIDRNTIRPFMSLTQAPNASVTRNQVLGSPADEAPAGIHIRGSLGGGTLADRNEVSGDTVGIAVSNTDAILTRNLVSDNDMDGIQVVNAFRPVPGIVVDRNRSERNGDDGIDVDVPATISNNFANFNGDLGIEAVPGVTDGGGNKASGNGNPAQCVGVRCK